VGAENVIGYGMKTQEADRLAQQSAANIGLIKKQIDQYDVDAKQREADEASSKAFAELVGNIYGSDEFTQEDLKAGLQNLSSADALKAVGIYNQNNPENVLQIIEKDGRKVLYNSVTGRMEFMDEGTGSELPEAYTKGLALIKEQFAEGTPEYERAVQNLTDRTLGYDVTLGETAFGGQPAAGGAAGGDVLDASPEAVSFFQQIPEDRVTDVFLKDGQTTPEFDQYLSKLSEAGVSDDIISGVKTIVEQRAEEDRMGRFARGDFGEKKPGFLKSLLPGEFSINEAALELLRRSPELLRSSPLPGIRPKVPAERPIPQSSAIQESPIPTPATSLSAAPTTPPDPRLLSIQQARAIQESPISAPTTSRSTQEIIGEARAIQGLPSEVQLQDRALKQRQDAFENAKELARQELAKKLSGPDRDKVLKELEDARIDEIMSLKGKSAQTKTQKKVREALLKILRGPEFIRQYGIDELPGKLLDIIPDIRTKRERERLERLEKQQSK
jgi:hypothetical protein